MSDADDFPADLVHASEAVRLLPSCRPGRKLALSTIYRWVQSGKLRGWRLGRWLHVSRAELLGLLRPAGPRRQPPRRGPTPAEEAAKAAAWAERVLKEAGI